MFGRCHSLCVAPFLHEIIGKKAVPQRCNWYKISKCCDMMVRDKNPNAAIWLVRDTCTYPNVTIFSDGGNTTLYTDLKFFSYKKKKNSKMRLRQYFHIILDFELRCPTNWKFQEIGRKAWLCARFICEKRPPHKGSSMPKHPVCGKEWEKG